MVGDRGTFPLDLVSLPAGGVALGVSTGLFFTAGPPATFTEPVGMTALVSPAGVVGPLAAIGSRFTFNRFMRTTDSRVFAFGQNLGRSGLLSSALGAPGTAFAAPQPLAPSGGQWFLASSAANAVLVRRCRMDCEQQDLAVIRRSGGHWSAPRRVTRRGPDVGGGSMALEPDGSLAIAYARHFDVYVRRLTRSGTLTPAQHVGSATAPPGVTLAAGPDHRLFAAWGSQGIVESDAKNDFSAYIACSNAAGRFTGRSARIGRVPLRGVGRYVVGGVDVKSDASGRAVVGWTDYSSGRLIAKVARVGSGCSATAQTISLPQTDIAFGALAVSPSGAVTLALTAGRRGAEPPAPGTIAEAAHGIFATHSDGAGRPFSPPVQVSSADDNQQNPIAAIDETSRRSVIVWADPTSSAHLATAP